MDIITEIEKNLESINEVLFSFSFFPNNQHWISLCIDDNKAMEKVVNSYYMLCDHFKNDDCRLVIFDHQHHIDISILNERTTEIINIKNLKFDFDEMDKFRKHIPKDYKIDLRVEYAGAMILDQRRPLFGLFMSVQK